MATVLIVDDSAFQRSILRASLEDIGHKVLEAKDGRGGLEVLEKAQASGREIELITLDLLMPGMSGTEVLRELAEKWPTIPVFVLTADIQDLTRQQCEALGAKGFVHKPVEPADIQERVTAFFASMGAGAR